MKSIKYFLVSIIFLSVFLYTGIFANAQSGQIYEQYYITRIKDTQIGYTLVTQKELQENDKKFIVTVRHSELKFKRLGFTIKMLQDIEFKEDADGNPVSFSANVENQGENINIEGKFIYPDKIQLTSIINGNTKTEEVNCKDKILFPYAINNLFKNQVLESLDFSSIDPSNGFKIVKINAKKIGSETLADEGLQGNYTVYKVSADILPGISVNEWHDSEGRLVKEQTSILGMEEVAVDKDKIADKISSFDIFYKSIIPVSTHIPDPFFVDNITYKIDSQAESPEDMFVVDGRQDIIQVKDNAVFLKIKNEAPVAESYAYPVNIKDFAEYLRSGPFIMPDDPQISAKAKEVTGDEKDAYKIAKNMEKWVYDYLTKKDLAINFANASQVFTSRHGDCTEHSVLLASMLRAAGIPSKVVIGLIYTDNPEDAFAYHMWVKAYIGKWISLDPSFPSENFSPVHIALSESSLNSLTGKTDMILSIVKSLSGLKINVLDYSTISNNIVGVKLSDSSTNETIKSVDIGETKSDNVVVDAPIKVISLKNNTEIPSLAGEEKKKYIEESIRSGLYNFSKGEISSSVSDFEKASELIPYNDDFSGIKLAIKLASIGLFNLTNSTLNNIQDSKIWNRQIQEIRKIYFPKQLLSKESELILADALSKVNFQNDPGAAASLINGNASLGKSDYAHYVIAKANLAQNQTLPAISELLKAISINPVNLSYRLELARAYIKKNEFKKARKEIDFILDQNIADKKFIELTNIELYWLLFKENRKDNAKSQYYLALYYKTKGEYKAATDILNKLISNKVEDTYVYELLGDIYLHLDQFNDAKNSYNNALKLDRKSARALLGLGNIYRRNDKYKEALDYYLKAERINSDVPEIILAIADDYKLLSQEELAYEYYDKLLDLDNNNPVGNYNLALMYYNSGKVEKAEEYFKKALSFNPNYSACWLELTKIEMNKKNYFLAKSYLDAVNYLGETEYPQYYYYSGLINKNNENYTLAKNNFKRAIELKPDYKEAIQELDRLR